MVDGVYISVHAEESRNIPDAEFELDGVTVGLYNVYEVAEGASDGPRRIYQYQPIAPAVLAGATLDVETVDLGTVDLKLEPEFGLAMTLEVQLDPGKARRDPRLAWLQGQVQASNGIVDVANATGVSNVLRIQTPGGLALVAWFDYTEDRLVVSNNLLVWTSDGEWNGTEVTVTPSNPQELSESVHLTEMAWLMAVLLSRTTLDAKGSQHAVGKEIVALQRPPTVLARPLGAAATAAASDA